VTLAFAFYVRTWQSFSAVRDICPVAFCDFVDYYYPMGEEVFRSRLPVPGFLYSAFVAILLALFPPLGLNASLVLWGILQALFVSSYVYLFRRLVAAGLQIQLLFVTLILTSYPLLLNLMAGQVSVFIMVALLGMLFHYERGRHAAGAGLLALAVSVKFYPVVFLAPFAARRDVRFLLVATAACTAFLFVVPGVLLGADITLRFYSALFGMLRDSGWVVTNPHSQFLPHVVLRMAGAMRIDAHAHHWLLSWITGGVAAANMGLLFLVQRARLPHADLWSFQLVFLTIPFMLKTSWPHDFVFLPFVQAFLAWRLLDRERAAPGTATEVKRSHVSAWRAQAPDARDAVTSALLLLSILFSNIVFYNLVGSFALYGHLGFLFSADLFLLIASYVMLLPAALQAASGEIRSTDVRGSMAGREPPRHPLREDDALRAGKGKR
jgi:hypothetical protein